MLIVFGSINMDMVLTPSHMPQPGETVLCQDYDLFPGGKGANQALAAARMGARVALVGCTGADSYSTRILNVIRRQGVITSGVGESENTRTGSAIVLREQGSRSRRIVASGANAEARADQVPDEILRNDSMILTQTEVPAEEVFTLIRRAHARGVRVILNLAPAIVLPDDILSKVWILVVNELELRQVSDRMGIHGDTAGALAQAVARRGRTTCIVTLSGRGSIAVRSDGTAFAVNSLGVDAVDNTGAGDAYCGTLSACLYSGMPLEESVRWASAAGSLACTKHGTIDAFAYQDDIRAELDKIQVRQ